MPKGGRPFFYGSLFLVELYSDTAPEMVSPFADTDPRAISYEQVAAILERAHKRREAIPEPRAYWEEPGHHGSGREVHLRPRRRSIDNDVTGQWVRVPMLLPPMPEQHSNVGAVLLVGGLVVGAGALGWYLWKRHQKMGPAHVGDFDGLDLLGAD